MSIVPAVGLSRQSPPIYYSDESVTLYHGDSLTILPALDVRADVLLTDPPYFKVKEDEWDNQWDKAHEFLSWLGGFLDAAKPLLESHASVWVFASPAMTSSVERLVGERFRVLNSIRWVKEQGWHQKAEVAALRSYLSPWEGLILSEVSDPWPSPLAAYLEVERERAGISRTELSSHFLSATGGVTGCVGNWERAESLPTKQVYETIRAILGEGYLAKDYDALVRPFNISSRANSTDVWNFPTVSPYPGKHPCEKPSSMLRHMIETSSRPGHLILDPFAGSGSTLEAAKHTGRRAVGIEKDERYCRQIVNRLGQDTLFGGVV